MKWIQDSLTFFKTEKIYTLLSILILAGFLYYWISPKTSEIEPKPSQAVEDFMDREKKLGEKVEKAGSLKAFLKEKPQHKAAFTFVSFMIGGAFCLGALIDFLWIFYPRMRQKIHAHAPPAKTTWKPSMLYKVVLLFIAASMLLSFVFGFLRAVGALPISENFYLLFHTTLVDILCFVFMRQVVIRAGGTSKDLGLRMPTSSHLGKEALIGWGGYLAVLPIFIIIVFILMLLADFFHYKPPPHPLVDIFLEEEERSVFLIFYSVFLATVLGPILEEIFFRGFCYPIFKKKLGAFFAMVLTSSFFALIHENSFAFWPIFILGMGLNYIYEKRGSLYASMVLHITHNSVFIAYFFLAKDFIAREGG
jgi:uncharacterized protein